VHLTSASYCSVTTIQPNLWEFKACGFLYKWPFQHVFVTESESSFSECCENWLHEPMSGVFMPPQILLVSDYFYAYLRREHHLTHGLYLKKEDGSEATLVLKWPFFTVCLPYLYLFFLTFHSHYCFTFTLISLSFLSFLFKKKKKKNLFLSFAHLRVLPYVWMLIPPLGPKLFCERLFWQWDWLKVCEWYWNFYFMRFPWMMQWKRGG